jgi:hypothetical protein
MGSVRRMAKFFFMLGQLARIAQVRCDRRHNFPLFV